MNQAVHQLLQLILQGFAWVLRTIEALWLWSWTQIDSVAKISWGSLPAWKIVFGLVAIDYRRPAASKLARLAPYRSSVLDDGRDRARRPGRRCDGRPSLARRWVVARVPDDFWQKLLQTSAS